LGRDDRDGLPRETLLTDAAHSSPSPPAPAIDGAAEAPASPPDAPVDSHPGRTPAGVTTEPRQSHVCGRVVQARGNDHSHHAIADDAHSRCSTSAVHVRRAHTHVRMGVSSSRSAGSSTSVASSAGSSASDTRVIDVSPPSARDGYADLGSALAMASAAGHASSTHVVSNSNNKEQQQPPPPLSQHTRCACDARIPARGRHISGNVSNNPGDSVSQSRRRRHSHSSPPSGATTPLVLRKDCVFSARLRMEEPSLRPRPESTLPPWVRGAGKPSNAAVVKGDIAGLPGRRP
jgi:hypothetical protein